MRTIGTGWRVVSRSTFQPHINGYSTLNNLNKHKFSGLSSIVAPGSRPFIGCQRLAQQRTFSSLRSPQPTIYALSTAPGRAGIAVIRTSGEACLDVYHALCPGKKPPRPRYASVRTLYDPDHDPSIETMLDFSALVLYFPSPGTVTGEDILELHVHGGPAIVKAVLAAIPKAKFSAQHSAIRYAEPGEFTRRAFMNDRLDLTQVEALGDVLNATTEQQRKLSVRGAGGGIAERYESWRQQLLYARGELEALIDFSEDQHFDESPADLCASVAEQVNTLRQLLQVHRLNAVRGELLRNGLSISLLGAPNAGKSSLLNLVVGREAAIVSHEAGTTRDVVEVGLDIGGYFCRLGDTAGLRTSKQITLGDTQDTENIGQVEREGMRRAKLRAMESDVVIVVLSFETTQGATVLQLDDEVITTAAELVHIKNNVIVVINKADTSRERDVEDSIQKVLAALPGITRDKVYSISCKDAETPSLALEKHHRSDPGNIQAVLQGLVQLFGEMTAAVTSDTAGADSDPSVWQESLGATERHRMLLESCIGSLDAFLAEVQPIGFGGHASTSSEAEGEADIVVAAEHLRAAADYLAKITGRGAAGDVEEVLGVVFEKFCVGK